MPGPLVPIDLVPPEDLDQIDTANGALYSALLGHRTWRYATPATAVDAGTLIWTQRAGTWPDGSATTVVRTLEGPAVKTVRAYHVDTNQTVTVTYILDPTTLAADRSSVAYVPGNAPS